MKKIRLTMKKIFVDMDGVLSDFEGRYRNLFNSEPGEKRDDKFSHRWRTFVDDDQFMTLDEMPEAKELIKFLNSKKEPKIILSSTGGFYDHDSVCRQKKVWLASREITWPAVFVPGKQYKPGYAEKNALLIDDTLSIIVAFQKAGGVAVHHTELNETIDFVESWLDD